MINKAGFAAGNRHFRGIHDIFLQPGLRQRLVDFVRFGFFEGEIPPPNQLNDGFSGTDSVRGAEV